MGAWRPLALGGGATLLRLPSFGITDQAGYAERIDAIFSEMGRGHLPDVLVVYDEDAFLAGRDPYLDGL